MKAFMQNFANLLPAVLFLLLPSHLSGQSIRTPELRGRVNDYAGILPEETETLLNDQLARLEETDSTQLAVLTVPSLEGVPIEEFSIRTAEAWKLGTEEFDNGVLLVVAPEERKVRIEVGYGLEGRLTDLLAGRIVDTVIVPEFRFGRYDQGIRKGVAAITSAVRGEYKADEPARENEGATSLFPFFVLFFIVSAVGSRRKILGGILGAVLLPLFLWMLFSLSPLLLLLLIPGGFILGIIISLFSLLPWSSGRRSRRRGFWGGHYHSGFSGFSRSRGSFRSGGFSGGGGGFGGGGASGSW